MKTTNLFVELVVVGSGTLAALILLSCSFIDIGDLIAAGQLDKNHVLYLYAFVPMLALTYVLGIVSDRISDKALGLLKKKDLREKHFKCLVSLPKAESENLTKEERKEKSDAINQAYHTARRILITASPKLYEMRQYGRSRIRVCRGWLFNCILIGLAGIVFIFVLAEQFSWKTDIALLIFLPVVGSIAGALYFSWVSLVKSEYLQVKHTALFFVVGGLEFYEKHLSIYHELPGLDQPKQPFPISKKNDAWFTLFASRRPESVDSSDDVRTAE